MPSIILVVATVRSTEMRKQPMALGLSNISSQDKSVHFLSTQAFSVLCLALSKFVSESAAGPTL